MRLLALVVMSQGRVSSGAFIRYSVLIHEQNAVAGFTNAQLSRVAKVVCEAFPNTFPVSEKVVTTGNPVRREITDILSPKWRYDERAQAGQPLNFLIVGGSLGAKALNERLPPALKQLQVPLNIFHQCGQQQVEATQALYADAPANLTVQVLPLLKIWQRHIVKQTSLFAVLVL